MRAALILTPIILLVFAGSFLAKRLLVESGAVVPPDAGQCERIVSMAPSITQLLFALDLGDRVVGVTRYCHHPAEAKTKPKVGGYLDPNFEAIVSLEPDLVLVIPSSHENRLRLESLGIRVLEVDQHDVGAVLRSVSTVAEACGVPDRGEALRGELEVDRSSRHRQENQEERKCRLSKPHRHGPP